MTKDIVILTKSKKWFGHCVAGVDINTGEWVRLTSSDQKSHGALTDEHMTYADGDACEVLDCVRVEIVRETPIPHQPENVLIDEGQKLQKLGTWTFQQVLQVHPAENLESVYGDTEPYLNEEGIRNVDRSLALIRVPFLCIKQWPASPQNPRSKPKTKAKFYYNNQLHKNFSVTDRDFYQVEDDTTIKPAYLVVSLPDAPIDTGLYYKFIARIFVP